MPTATDKTTRSETAVAAGPQHPRAILAIILISYFMILLDNSIIFTALPKIHRAFDYSTTGLAWVQDAYTLVFGGLLLLGARAGDLLGRRRVFVFGLIVFSVASALVGAAPTGWVVVAARALQGVGAAIVAPSSLSLLTASFPAGKERAKAIAAYAATAGIGASLGMVVGGAAADFVSWRAGFFLNLPLGIAMIVLAPRYLPDTARLRGRFDAVGALSATIGVGAIVFGIIHSAESGWTSPATIAALAGGALLLLCLVICERRVSQPIMPLRLFGSSQRVGAYLSRMLYLGAMIGFFYFTTQYLQGVLGFSAFAAGLAFFPMTVVNFAVAMAIPRLTGRVGQALPLVAGVVLTLAGMAWLSQVTASSSYWTAVAAPMVLIGAGQGLAFAPLTAFGIAGVQDSDAGAASGMVNTFHQVGMALGLGVLVTASAHAGTGTATPALALASHVHTALLGGSGLLLLSLVTVLALIVPKARSRHEGTRTTEQPVGRVVTPRVACD